MLRYLSSYFPARRLAVVIALATLVMPLGCARGKLYKATNMPHEFLVAARDNAQTINLSKLASAPSATDRIDCGDVLEVTMDTGYGTTRGNTSPVRVGDDGNALVPLVGRVTLAGLELEAAEQMIAAAGVERGLFRNPSVTVVMKRQRTNRITVVGAVKEEGVYDLPRGSCDLLAALVRAKGLSKEAGTEVEVSRGHDNVSNGPRPAGDRVARTQAELAAFQRGGKPGSQAGEANKPKSYTINLVSAAKQGSGGYRLEDGDVVTVKKLDQPPVMVLGLVAKPDEIELPVNRDMRVLDVIAKAGGVSSSVADKIHVIRHVPGREEPVVIEVSYAEAKRTGQGNLRLAPGDVVSVEQTPSTVMVDTLKSFLHFGLGATVPF